MADTPNTNRGHRGFHRGRRGPDRRGRGERGERQHDRGQQDRGDRGQDRGGDRAQDTRPQAGGPPPIRTENADVAQIMRDIRARIAQRHGISLTDQQVEELAARRLDAILDVRALSPELLDQLRRAAGGRSVEVPTGPEASGYRFEADTIYETPNGLVRSLRRLLNPLLKLLFNPEPLIMALHQQSLLNAAAASREAERVAQQAEWNALHYALLQRLVSENAKLSLEAQHLAQQVESLSAKVDFSDRRVRSIEGGIHQVEVRTAPQQPIAPRAESGFTPAAADGGPGQGDGTRRKRRRRRGRRPGSGEPSMGGAPMTGDPGDQADEADGPDEGPEDGAFGDQEAAAPERAFEAAAPAPAPAPDPGPAPVADEPAPRDPLEP